MRINKLFKLMAVSALTMTALTGCGNSSSNGDVKEVAIIQYVEHTSLNTIKDAFDEQMEALGYKEGENIKYTFKNAQGDMNTAPSIIQDFKSSKKDCVVAIATPVAQTAAEMSTDTPVVFAAVTDPIKAGLTTSLEKPDKNITGTSDEIQVEMIETTVTGVNEVQSAIDVLTSKCDAVFAPNDNTVANAMDMVGPACAKAKVPLYVGADSMVQDGGFLSVGINYEDLGKETANMVDKILKGEKVENIPVKVFKENLSVYVNTKVLKQLGITLPNEIKNDKAYVEIKE